MFDFLKRRFKTKDDWNSKVRQNCANSGEMKIYNYFDNDCIKVYDAATIEELSPKILSCVCAFQYTTLGAMGLGGIILMFNENGDSYSVSYFGEEIKQDANGNNIEQLKTLYKAWDIILNNCSSLLFFGCCSVETLKCLSEFIGNQISVDKLKTIDTDECVLNIRELPPFYNKKFDVENHINYDKLEK